MRIGPLATSVANAQLIALPILLLLLTAAVASVAAMALLPPLLRWGGGAPDPAAAAMLTETGQQPRLEANTAANQYDIQPCL